MFIPETISELAFVALLAASFVGSFLSTAVGIGGGVTLLAVMAQVMPPIAIIPCHGVVQAGSNLSRISLFFRHIDWQFIKWFAAGSLIGALIAYQFVVALPVLLLQALLGGFILYAVWGPFPDRVEFSPMGNALFGGVTTFGSMFVGATGPFVMALIRAIDRPKTEKVATFSSVMVTQHGLKVGVFGAVGFNFIDYLPLLGMMIFAGFLGTLVGRQVLMRQSEKHFALGLNLVLTGLALRLLWQSRELVTG